MEKPFRHRWYDRYNNIRSLVDVSEHLPSSVQHSLGENLVNTVERYKLMCKSDEDLKMLGAEVVLGMFKSRRKNRWYDQVPALHKAYNQMAMLPDTVLQHLNVKCGELIQYIESQKAARALPPKTLAHMINSYLAISADNNDMELRGTRHLDAK